MKAVAVFNNKGGVGKTTLLCNMAAYFALKAKKKVLVIDADPQCNATQLMLTDSEALDLYTSKRGFTIYSVIDPLTKGKGYATELIPRHVTNYGVDLIPGDPRLALKEDTLSQDWMGAKAGEIRGLRTTFVFSELLNRCGKYDLVFIDVGPSLGGLNRAVLIGSDFFVTPMSTDIFSLKAVENIGQTVLTWQRHLENGLALVHDKDELELTRHAWNLKFAGYVTQQYTFRRDAYGTPRAVKAYDRIMRHIPTVIRTELVNRLGAPANTVRYELGSIPNFHSLIPLSQIHRKPIFALRGADGVVGAHFAKVKDYHSIIHAVGTQFAKNINKLGDSE